MAIGKAVEIQPAVALDYTAIQSLLAEWQGHPAGITQEQFQQYLNRERQHLALARNGQSQAVGFIGWTVWLPVLSWPKPTCFIEELFVISSQRRLGIGSALVEHVRNWSSLEGIPALHLETSNDAAIHLYQKMGFQSVNTSLYWFDSKR